MLRAQSNVHRRAEELSGFWNFRIEEDAVDASTWSAGVPAGEPIAVPGSWNDQLPHLRDFCGIAWYETRFFIDEATDRRRLLRFGAVSYAAEVWVNGRYVGRHDGSHMCFGFDITDECVAGANRLVVRVDNEPSPERVPPGEPKREAVGMNLDKSTDLASLMMGMLGSFPKVEGDFFPYGGIQRPVVLSSVHRLGLDDVRVLETDPATGVLRIGVSAPDGVEVSLQVEGVTDSASIVDGQAELCVTIPDVVPWAPGSPHLYEAIISVTSDGATIDEYRQRVGMRSIAVEGDRLMLNGEPVTLLGFGRHEDYPIIGRGSFPAGNIRDYAMMRWMGANSFRTSHYPYSEEQLDLADELGFLVISETPAVGLSFNDDAVAARLARCCEMTRELIERDRNRPSVIMWSVANEPNAFKTDVAVAFFEEVVGVARGLDDRPLTIANPISSGDPLRELCDVVCVNRYSGWYANQGDIAGGTAVLARELDALHARLGKPIVVTEFGCDTIAGHHAEPPEMWSEEYQAEFLTSYITMMSERPFVAGQHIWNLTDFKTGQGILRAGAMNQKGVLTRDRRPKAAAHAVRRLWTSR